MREILGAPLDQVPGRAVGDKGQRDDQVERIASQNGCVMRRKRLHEPAVESRTG
ncbi:hypothetical protein [Bradyrhizobium sp. McL0616]|uniref:hypothetical protein n=1 Tax=Bradyrhizobium sp. McL0616 TaxID=3415674 RepID=UPI003CF54E1C